MHSRPFVESCEPAGAAFANRVGVIEKARRCGAPHNFWAFAGAAISDYSSLREMAASFYDSGDGAAFFVRRGGPFYFWADLPSITVFYQSWGRYDNVSVNIRPGGLSNRSDS